MHFRVLDYFNHWRVKCQAQNASRNTFLRIFKKILRALLRMPYPLLFIRSIIR